MNTPTTRAGTILGLPAFHVELRYITEERDLCTGACIEAIHISKPYADPVLAEAEWLRLFNQFIGKRDGRWRLVLTDAVGKILRESTP